jgi:succinate dehydrogenase/fumarate reductase flavoprotein subunit
MGRYWGGKMMNWKGEDFLRETYAKRWGRLRSMHLEILNGNAPLYWDATGLSKEKMKKRNAYASYEKHQPDIYLPESYRQRGLEPRRDKVEAIPIPIGFLGGADFRYNGGTSIEGLYAAGDEIWMDSLSGAFVFARRAGEAAAKYAKQTELKSVDEEQLKSIEETVLAPSKRYEGIPPIELEEKVRSILTRYANVTKSEGMLRHGLALIKELRDRVLPQLVTRNPHELMRAVEVRNIMDVAEMHMTASLYRTETVPYGRHFLHRIDYPTQNPTWYRQRIIVKREAGEMKLAKRETTEQRVPTQVEYLAVKEIKP